MTLLQNLLLNTLEADTDPILRAYIKTVLPMMEQEFGLISALGGSEAVHRHRLQGDRHLEDKIRKRMRFSDQSLLVHVLNALLTAWNLLPFLDEDKQLSDDEKRLLCLGLTLHDYNKYCEGGEEDSPKAHEVSDILRLCEELGEKLNFSEFWHEWRDYLSEISYLAQNTQLKTGTNPYPSNWAAFKLDDRRLDVPLRPLLAFGDVAVHMSDPADLIVAREGNKKRSSGDALQEHLDALQIDRKLVYHRLRDCTGLLSNGIHNAVLHFTADLDWQPLLFFAQGVIYLAPMDAETPDRETLQVALWDQVSQLLSDKMLSGEAGSKRSGKGLGVAPQIREFSAPIEIIRQFPDMVIASANFKKPSLLKRLKPEHKDPTTQEQKRKWVRDQLEKFVPNDEERELLKQPLEQFSRLGTDGWADCFAELIILAKKQFFKTNSNLTPWILSALEVENQVSIEQAQIERGGTYYGWYYTSARYILNHPTWNSEQLEEKLRELANKIVDWAETNHLLPEHHSPTRDIFLEYVGQYLEVAGWDVQAPSFEAELVNYTAAKTKAAKQPICSLSSGEFASEDQMDSVVLFKPQQYSNKNPLGGRQIKRGISKIWSLEMLLRQAIWSVPAGKLEDQQPVFLSIFPAYVYSPQVAKAVRVLVNELKRVNFWEVRKFWQENGMEAAALRQYAWVQDDDESPRFADKDYGKGDVNVKRDLPFMAITHTTTRGKTVTDAWVEPAFLAMVLPFLLGVKVVASTSPIPLYNSDREFRESVKLDGPAGFWNALGLPTSMHLEEWLHGRVQRLDSLLNRLLIAYTIHLECEGDPPDPRDPTDSRRDSHWRRFPGTVREMTTNVLNIFSLANKGFRRNQKKRFTGDQPTAEEVERYWHYTQVWSEGDSSMQQQHKLIECLTRQYREFYQVSKRRLFSGNSSSHELLLPLSTALDVILKNPTGVDPEDVILQGSGQLFDVIERKRRQRDSDVYLPLSTQSNKELEAIRSFMETCVYQLLGNPETKEGFCKGDRALLQENRNRIKSGAEFAYRWLALQEKQAQAEQNQTETQQSEGDK